MAVNPSYQPGDTQSSSEDPLSRADLNRSGLLSNGRGGAEQATPHEGGRSRLNPGYHILGLVILGILIYGAISKSIGSSSDLYEEIFGRRPAAVRTVPIPSPTTVPISRTSALPDVSRHYLNNHPRQSDQTLNEYIMASRNSWQQPYGVMESMGIESADHIADIGAGSGYFTGYFSEKVGINGKVYAVDIDPNAIKFLERRKKEENWQNVTILLDSHGNELPGIPEDSLDFVFFCDVHLLNPDPHQPRSDPFPQIHKEALNRYFNRVHGMLKDGGELVWIERNDPGSFTARETRDYFLSLGDGQLFALKSYTRLPRQMFFEFISK